MPDFLVMYDLIDASPKEYEDLEDELRALGASHVQDSVWHLSSSANTCKKLVANVERYMDRARGDRLVVSRCDAWDGFNSWGDGPK